MDPREIADRTWDCRGCGALVVTAYSVYGRRMTIDATPRENGNLVLEWRRNPGEKTAFLTSRVYLHPEQKETLFNVDPPPDHLYIDHHVVCPDAEKFR